MASRLPFRAGGEAYRQRCGWRPLSALFMSTVALIFHMVPPIARGLATSLSYFPEYVAVFRCFAL